MCVSERIVSKCNRRYDYDYVLDCSVNSSVLWIFSTMMVTGTGTGTRYSFGAGTLNFSD